jgi:cysteine synthase
MPSITELVGQTPLVPIPFENPSVKIFGKMEGHNPGGSVKDRAALGMIRSAMERGALAPGDHLIEATSGNTGIALAMIGRGRFSSIYVISSVINRLVVFEVHQFSSSQSWNILNGRYS